jgi:WD40 repeat protein
MSLAFSFSGDTLYSGGWDKTIRVWEVSTGLPRSEPLKANGQVTTPIIGRRQFGGGRYHRIR